MVPANELGAAACKAGSLTAISLEPKLYFLSIIASFGFGFDFTSGNQETWDPCQELLASLASGSMRKPNSQLSPVMPEVHGSPGGTGRGGISRAVFHNAQRALN